MERIRDLHRDISSTGSANQLCPSPGVEDVPNPSRSTAKTEIQNRRPPRVRPDQARYLWQKRQMQTDSAGATLFYLKLVFGGRNDKKNTVRSIICDIAETGMG